MTDNKPKLDIAQRIAEAIARTSKPTTPTFGDFVPDEDAVIGEVPVHLQHLHNLLDKVGDEASAAERRFREARKCYDAIHSIFFGALEQHVPSDEYDGVKLCLGWKVIGYKRDDDGGEMGTLGKLLAMAAMGGRS